MSRGVGPPKKLGVLATVTDRLRRRSLSQHELEVVARLRRWLESSDALDVPPLMLTASLPVAMLSYCGMSEDDDDGRELDAHCW